MTAALADRLAAAVERRFGARLADRPGRAAELVARHAPAGATELYVARVEAGDPALLRALAPDVCVGETYFFRHVEQCRAFADRIGELAARGPVRVLSAACSTGEEPYTLAMLAAERLGDLRRAAPQAATVTIDAFDVNPDALARARAGSYTRWALRATTPEQERRWFEPAERGVRVIAAIRDAVRLFEANLLDDSWATQRYDIVFCRNTVMYFGDATARDVLARLVRAVAPGGYLFLGHAEAVRDRGGELVLCQAPGTFYYRRGEADDAGAAMDAVQPARWIEDIDASSRRIARLADGAREAAPVPADRPSATLRVAAPSGGAGPCDPLAAVRDLLVTEQFVAARAALAELPVVDRDTPDARRLAALAEVQAGDVAAARAACVALVAADPNDAAAHHLLALCAERAGDVAAALHHARAARAADPTFAMATVQLARLAKRGCDSAEHVALLARAIEVVERERDARWALFAGGLPRTAVVQLCRSELASARRVR